MGLSVGKIIILLLAAWLVIILLLSRPLLQGNEPDEQVLARLTRAVEELEALKQQNEELRNLLNTLKFSTSDKGKGDVAHSSENKPDNALPLQTVGSEQTESSSVGIIPSKEFEVTRRKIENGVMEMWYFVRSELKKLIKTYSSDQAMTTNLQRVLEDTTDHKRTILVDLAHLKNLDGLEEWRKKEAEDLSRIVQERLHYLQNPKNCKTAKKLVCHLNKGCGYGCQIHHVVYCLIVAYGTQRTLILRSKNWRYSQDGWESVFLPISKTCLSEAGESRSYWPGTPDTQVIDLPIIDNVRPRPPYLPLAIPQDLADRLIRFHGNPIVWWISQFLKYLLRYQDDMGNFLIDSEKKLNFRHPVVGVHVRRTDKIGTEAAFHPIEEYMEFVEDYFKQLALTQPVPEKLVYLATDDPNLLSEAERKYPGYKFLGDPNIAKSAAVGTRYSSSSLRGVILDIHMLAKCDYIVCTFSSQVCRLAYEIMQTYHPDPSANFHSLDDMFYYGGQSDHNQQAIYDHKAQSPNEIDMQKGDIVGIAGNHWDGYSKGLNRRTKQSGLYPSYKAIEKIDIMNFPAYPEAHNSSNS